MQQGTASNGCCMKLALLQPHLYCPCRPAGDAGSSSATGLATETILEDEAEQEDVAPTPEQLEVRHLLIVHACLEIGTM